MHNPSYLMLSRHNLYYFRYPLPKAQNNKREYIKISLKTRTPKEALHLSKGLEYYVAEICRRYRDILMNDKEAKAIVKEHCQKLFEKRRQGILEQGELSNKQIEIYKRVISQKGLYEEAGVDIYEDSVQALISDKSLNISKGSDDYKMLLKHYNRAIPDLYSELLQLNESQKVFSFQPALQQAQTATEVYRLDEAVDKFFEAAKTERDWEDSRKEAMVGFLALLKEVLGGDFNIAMLDKKRASEIADIVYKIPIHRNKDKRTKGLSILEAINVSGTKKVSAGTIKKYLGAYNTFFEWCERRGYVESNPFEKLKKNVAKGGGGRREPYSPERMQMILEQLEMYPNGIVKQEYQYWGALIGAYTGARLNEVAQLELNDIQQENGIWYFHINDDGDSKKLKTKSAKRKTPIHKKLLEKGILEYAEGLKKRGKDRLLHELTYGRSGYGRNLSRFFNERLLEKLGIKEKLVDYHCLRTTVITRLRQADVPLTIVQSAVGHKRSGGATEIYFKEGYTLKQLHKAINKLPY